MLVIDALEIRPRNSLSAEQERQICAAGYDLDRIRAEEGVAAEELHDAMFLTEDIARTTLGTNYNRIIASIEHYSRMVDNLRPRRVVDFGGGCGITCFDAAERWRSCEFIVCDRSLNALEIGSQWAGKLGLTNVKYQRLDFTHAKLESVLRSDNDLIVFEYVFRLGFEFEEESEVITHTLPGMNTAAPLLGSRGMVCVRFGEFSEHGLTGLVRAAYRAGLFVQSVSGSDSGFTFLFDTDNTDRSEDAEVFCALDDFGCQVRAMDSGE